MFVVILFLIGASTYLGVKQLTKQSSTLRAIRTQQEVSEQEKSSQAQAKKELERYTELNEITKSIVPQDKDQAKTIREINSIAKSSGVSLQTINFSTSTLGQKQASSQGGSAEPTSSTPNITQVKAVDGVKGVYAMEITIANTDSTTVSYPQLIDFLSKLESNRRTAHVDKISITPKKGRLVFNITLNAYVKP